MLVDYERSWLRLKQHVLSKNSHGQRELLAAMARAEVECAIPEGEEGFDPAPLVKKPATRPLREVARHG